MITAFALPFFQTALVASLVIAGMHAYLGFHIVRRGVIFVDLALAQMAALGMAVALVINVHENESLTYLLALGMTFVGAALFAWLRGRQRSVPMEAFIGIVFATAQAAVFLVLEKSPSGPEHLKETLVGSLFTVDPWRVFKVALLYIGVSIAHFLLRKPLFEITTDPQGAEARGRRVFWWDFVFYAMFGLVVTWSVQIAGVLLVFGFLVIPAVAGLMATQRTGRALAIGGGFGFLGSFLGLVGSIHFDMPAAPSILVALTILLIILGAGLGLRHGMRHEADEKREKAAVLGVRSRTGDGRIR